MQYAGLYREEELGHNLKKKNSEDIVTGWPVMKPVYLLFGQTVYLHSSFWTLTEAEHLTFLSFIMVFSSTKIVSLICINTLINTFHFFFIPPAFSFVSIFSCYPRTRTFARTPGWRFGHDCLIFVRPKPILSIVDSFSDGQHAHALTWYLWLVRGRRILNNSFVDLKKK